MNKLGLGFAALTLALFATIRPHAAQAMTPPEDSIEDVGWIVDAAQAKVLIDGGALVWDVRPKRAYMWSHVEGAVHVTWQEFSKEKGADHGELLAAGKLQSRLRAKGVGAKRAVVVIGDPLGGWGEEGRLVWMLRAAGHERAAFVDGGFDALKALKVKTERGGANEVAKGDFTIKAQPSYSADAKRVGALMKQPGAVIVDTRERREFEGKTPYGEARGGHVPGAVHLYYKDLLGKDGRLLPKAQLEARLSAAGLKKGQPVVAYCTGGIRSGWFVAVLRSLGYGQAQNYAGSMWQWAAAEAAQHPLESAKP